MTTNRSDVLEPALASSPIPAADRFEPTEITEQDLSAAMTEILTSGGRLTRRLLGYRTEDSV